MKSIARQTICNKTLCLSNSLLHLPDLFVFIFMLRDYITFSVNVSTLTEGYDVFTINLGFILITFTVSIFSYRWK